MKIAACVKYSLDISEIRVDASSRQLRLEGTPRKLGNIDRNVLEMAATLKETYGGIVHIVSFGPPEVKDALKEALAMEADGATVVHDPFGGKLDASVTAHVLAAVLGKLGGFDLVVCGEASEDDSTYQVGPQLAEKLGYPQVAFVRSATMYDGFLVAERDAGDYTEKVRVMLPALITVTEETNTPRRPTLMEVLKAKKKPVVEWQLETDLHIHPSALEGKAALRLLNTEAVMVRRKGVLLRDKPVANLADELVDLLLQEQAIER